MRAVNLIPSDQRRTVSAAGRSGGGAYAVLTVLGGFAILAFLYGQAHRQVSDRTSRAASLTARAQQAQAAAAQLAPYTSFVALREQRMQAVSQLVDSRFDWPHALHELGRVLPHGASVTSLEGLIGSSTPGSTSAAPAASLTSAAPAASPTSGSASAGSCSRSRSTPRATSASAPARCGSSAARTSRTSSSSSVAARSKIGAIARQGPQQAAQRSTSSGMSLCLACLSKRATLFSTTGRPS